MRVLVFGDSITQGFWDSEGGWVQRIRKMYDKKQIEDLVNRDEPTIFNLGVSADKIASVIKRFVPETEARKYHGESFAFVFSIGTNDTYLKGKENASTPQAYTDALDTLHAAAIHYSNKILFVGLTPVDEKRTAPVFWDENIWTNERITQFDKVLRDFCQKNSVAYVPIFETFQAKQQQKDLLADGLHPNDDGHQLIAELVKPALDKLLSPKPYVKE